MTPTLAVLVPCLNEEVAIAKVVRDFRQALPGATLYVYDNGSTDGTAAVARAEGAVVRTEPLRGKGNVVRRMFADIEADVYVLVDGDDTYHAASAPALVQRLLSEQLDMVNASRVTEVKEAYRRGHRLGNRLLTGLVAALFGNRFRDLLSGYRVFSRRFVKSFPAASAGFEIETELTVHALELRMPLAEVDTPYKNRPAGSTSKLRTFRDGGRILLTILKLLKEERPLLFFSVLFGLFMLLALGLAYPLLVTYERTGQVPRLPTAVLSMGITLLAFMSLGCGIILDAVSRGRQDLKRLQYLSFCAVPRELSGSRGAPFMGPSGGGRVSGPYGGRHVGLRLLGSPPDGPWALPVRPPEGQTPPPHGTGLGRMVWSPSHAPACLLSERGGCVDAAGPSTLDEPLFPPASFRLEWVPRPGGDSSSEGSLFSPGAPRHTTRAAKA